MFQLVRTKTFDRDVKNYLRKGGSDDRLEAVLTFLREGRELPLKLNDHPLLGKLRQYRELHVEHDWLLVYERDGKKFRIFCLWLVTHKKLRERERTL